MLDDNVIVYLPSALLGLCVGEGVGAAVGARVGAGVGSAVVGAAVGVGVGAAVGASVVRTQAWFRCGTSHPSLHQKPTSQRHLQPSSIEASLTQMPPGPASHPCEPSSHACHVGARVGLAVGLVGAGVGAAVGSAVPVMIDTTAGPVY